MEMRAISAHVVFAVRSLCMGLAAWGRGVGVVTFGGEGGGLKPAFCRGGGAGMRARGPRLRFSGARVVTFGQGGPLCLGLGLGAGAEAAGPAVGLRPGLDLEVVIWNIQHGLLRSDLDLGSGARLGRDDHPTNLDLFVGTPGSSGLEFEY